MVWDNMEYSGIQWNNVEQLEIARCSGDQQTWKMALRAKMALDGQRGHQWGIGKEGFHAIPRYSIGFHIIPWYSTLSHSMLFHAIPFYSTLFHAIPRPQTLFTDAPPMPALAI